MANHPINYHLHTFLWNKYRPVVLKLMVDSAEAPQQYQFIQHEFKDINPKGKSGDTFTLQVYKGRVANNIKASVAAQDLFIMLEKSRKAMELMETAIYELSLDKHFLFQVTRIEPEITEEEGELTDGEESSSDNTDDNATEASSDEASAEA
ncbi:MAG: hypothetical protein OEX22_08980 [Cyclobacteriaceae bacterium]|nr:hypothetical protein [Cyclobacteriaceae bacterium]